MKKHDIDKLEEYWKHHGSHKRQLRFREWELLHPMKEQRSGGAGGGVSSPTERDGLVLASDPLYCNLKRTIQAVERLYDEADEEMKQIIHMRYWDRSGECYEWEDIADHLHMSRSKVLRKRNVLLDRTANLIGYI